MVVRVWFAGLTVVCTYLMDAGAYRFSVLLAYCVGVCVSLWVLLFCICATCWLFTLFGVLWFCGLVCLSP